MNYLGRDFSAPVCVFLPIFSKAGPGPRPSAFAFRWSLCTVPVKLEWCANQLAETDGCFVGSRY